VSGNVGLPAPRLSYSSICGHSLERVYALKSAFSPQPCNGGVVSNAERWEMCSDRVGNIARSKMRVVLFRHARVRMAELFGNDSRRHAAHRQR
jgi:hypothetical protein